MYIGPSWKEIRQSYIQPPLAWNVEWIKYTYTTSITKSYWHFQEEPHLWICIRTNNYGTWIPLTWRGNWQDHEKYKLFTSMILFSSVKKPLNINLSDCTATSTNRLKQPLEIRKPLWCKKRWQSLHGKCGGGNLKDAKSLFHENSTGWGVCLTTKWRGTYPFLFLGWK